MSNPEAHPRFSLWAAVILLLSARTTLSTIPNPKPIRHSAPAPIPIRKRARWWWVALPSALVFILLVILAVMFIHYQDLQDALRKTEEQSARQTTELSDARRVLDTMSAPGAERITLRTPASREPNAEVVYQRDRGRLAMVASNLAPLRQEHVYQLWLNAKGTSKPLSAGTFSPDERGHASLFMAMPPNLEPEGFQVTIEPKDGATTPTTAVVLSGSLK